MSVAYRALPARHRSFLLRVGVLLPLACAALAVLLRSTGWDHSLSAAFYDASTHHFLVSNNGWLELLGHRVGKSVVLAFWMLLLATAIAAPAFPQLARHQTLLWTVLLAMALGPTLVTVLKDVNSRSCPWSLKDFGGAADYTAEWFVRRVDAGHCFPGGHAAGGYSLVAIAFAGQVLQQPRMRRIGLWLGFGVGSAFSLLRLAQGAHFMSHNLWAAAIDLWMAALAFAPLMLRGTPTGQPPVHRTSRDHSTEGLQP